MADPKDTPRKPLVSLEFQTEVDVSTGNAERRVFLKMYFDARDSGLLADMPDRLWKTLCCLATYMDENGFCYPSQARLAKDLGISRQKTNARVRDLMAYRFQGRPVITVTKNRVSRPGGSRWTNNVYQLRPITGFAIFDAKTPKSPQKPAQSSMSPLGDIEKRPSVSGKGDTETGRKGDTNKNQDLTRRLTLTTLEKGTPNEDDEEARRRDLHAQALTFEILDVCKDEHSRGSYLQIARTYPEQIVRTALSITKDQALRGRIRKSRGAYFTDMVQRLARERGIDTDQGREVAG